MNRLASYCAVLIAIAMTIPHAALSETSSIPPIRLSQLGFQPAGPKRAILENEARSPLDWRLVDAAGTVQAAGQTQVFGENAGSGEHVHIIDFSRFNIPGADYRLIVAREESRAFPIAAGIFGKLKYDALSYFYHNRSGIPIEAKYAGDEKWSRPAGHLPEIVSCFDKEDERGNNWPGCDYELNATGGWYDAGDHGKYVVNAGISVWTLLNYYERALRISSSGAFADGSVSIPERSNGSDDLLDEVRWELKFLLGMQAPQGAKLRVSRPVPQSATPTSEFVELDVSGMAHHKLHGEQWTPVPSAPHEDTKPRNAYPPSTTATLNLAANAAQCARIWREIDADFAKQCLAAAQRAYDAAHRHRDLLPTGDFEGGGGYGDRDASDEFYWAAAELFVTTGQQTYLDALRASPHFLAAPQQGAGDIAWSQVRTLGTISLAVVLNRLPDEDLARARANLISAADLYSQQAKREGYAIPYSSPQYQWGSNSAILNHAIVLGLAYDLTGKTVYRDRVVDALDYVLGRNPLDQSYVSGYGARPMRNPHHRYWAQSKDPAYPSPPPGALSGGPNSSSMIDPIARMMKGRCRPQTCWEDHIDAYALNEVAINWNAPLFWVAAFLDE
jgi:endoglucanase